MRPGPVHPSSARRLFGRAGMMVWLALQGCSPALNWREVRLEGPGLLATFPCRPVAQVRQIMLAGRSMAPQLHACEAAGGTYAVMVADVGDPAAVDGVLRALRDASFGKLESPEAASAVRNDWLVPGMTPQAVAGRWQLAHARPGEAPVRMDTALFARGTWVLQASVIGATAQERAGDPFFEGLHFAP